MCNLVCKKPTLGQPKHMSPCKHSQTPVMGNLKPLVLATDFSRKHLPMFCEMRFIDQKPTNLGFEPHPPASDKVTEPKGRKQRAGVCWIWTDPFGQTHLALSFLIYIFESMFSVLIQFFAIHVFEGILYTNAYENYVLRSASTEQVKALLRPWMPLESKQLSHTSGQRFPTPTSTPLNQEQRFSATSLASPPVNLCSKEDVSVTLMA